MIMIAPKVHANLEEGVAEGVSLMLKEGVPPSIPVATGSRVPSVVI